MSCTAPCTSKVTVKLRVLFANQVQLAIEPTEQNASAALCRLAAGLDAHPDALRCLAEVHMALRLVRPGLLQLCCKPGLRACYFRPFRLSVNLRV